MSTDKYKVALHGNNIEVAIQSRRVSDELIVFLHGIGCSKASFCDVWERRDFENFSILTLDMLGFGDSPQPSWFSYTMEEQAEVCEAVLRNFLDNRRLHIVAHSMGGAVGLLLSEKLPGRIASFCSVEGNLIEADCFLTKIIKDSPFDLFENKIFPNFTSQNNFQTDPELTEEQKKLIQIMRDYQADFFLDKTTPAIFYKTAESLVSHSESGKLLTIFSELAGKKAYFYGSESSSVDVLAELKKYPAIETQSISESGHFVMNDNPDEFYSALRDFLRM